MPVRTIPSTTATYSLIAFDKHGTERTDDPDGVGGRLSARILADITDGSFTDIFMYSHGWKGDVPAAIDQYDRWFKALCSLDADQTRMAAGRPAFKPLHIGLHWPSLPWGDEEFGGAAFGPGAAAENLVEMYADRLDDSPRVRRALEIIIEEARRNAAADTMPPRAREAYLDLDKALDLGEEGVGGDAASDREPFDPDTAMAASDATAGDFSGLSLGGVLSPLRQLSFWSMKKRGQTIGEGGLHNFLIEVMNAAPRARVHLMGHSFGCVVVSSMLNGPDGTARLPRPVDSCVLVQGAMSLWAYCKDIPVQRGTAGYCHGIVDNRKVSGPIVTTRSRFDKAVGTFYPLAAGVAGQVAFDPAVSFPKYGGTGAYGLQGRDGEDLKMKPATASYGFEPGRIYNVEASEFVRNGGGASGAHSDIAGPEVAHLIWSTARPE